jgi:FkbM family methyltransferase
VRALPPRHAPTAVLEACGVLIPDDPEIITPAIRRAIFAGRFEAEEASQLAAIVKPGDRVLEIGAGIGFISTLLARQPGVTRVVAVEANPRLMPYMARLHDLNDVGRVRRINAVLSNDPASCATFYLRRDFWMGSLSPVPNAYAGTVEVPTMNLDALLRDEAIDLVVCDVEGAEAWLFEGGDLAAVDRVWVETHDHLTGLSGVRRLFATMAAQGFVYDPRRSLGSVVLFQKLGATDIVRPYAG